MLMISCGVTPFVGAVFNLETITSWAPVEIKATGQLINRTAQADKMTGGIFNSAYALAWLQAEVPRFTTRDIALEPFGLARGIIGKTQKGLLSAETLGYQTNLHCTPSLGRQWPSNHSHCEDPGYLLVEQGCGITGLGLPIGSSPSTQVSYTGWYGSEYSGLSLEANGCPCPQDFSNAFLAYMWTNETRQETMLSCRTQYVKIRVNATIDISSDAVISWTPLAEPQELSKAEFNTALFDELLGTAVTALSESDTGVNGFLGTGNVDIGDYFIEDARAGKLARLRPGALFGMDLSSYAFSLDKRPMHEFLNATLFADAFQKTHRLLFALAIHSMMDTQDIPSAHRFGQLQQEMGAVTVSRTFVIIAQICLAASAAAASFSYIINRTRSTNLATDPGSIAQVTALVGRSIQHHTDGGAADGHSTVRPEDGRFRTLQPEDACSRPCVDVMSGCQPRADMYHETIVAVVAHESESTKIPVRALEVRTFVLLSFTTALSLAIIGLVLLRRAMNTTNGVVISTQSAFVRNLILNYLPTLLGTLLEALWVVINRHFCLLQPFEDLRRGGATAATTLGARYATLPPQLIIWRALRSKHYILAIICFVAILANVVSVALSGLFITQPVMTKSNSTVRYIYDTKFTTSPVSKTVQLDYTYPLENNITEDAPLSTWTSPSHYFLPAQLLPAASKSMSGLMRVRTVGIGLTPHCEKADFEIAPNAQFGRSPVNITVRSNIHDIDRLCIAIVDGAAYYDGSGVSSEGIIEAAKAYGIAQEVSTALVSNTGSKSEPSDPCGSLHAFGWLRAGGRAEEYSIPPGNHSLPALAATIVVCAAEVQATEMEVLVDAQGNILNVDTAGASMLDIADMIPPGSSNVLVDAYVNSMLTLFTEDQTALGYWHNGTYSGDWMNYFIKLQTGSSAHVTPQLPPPDPEAMAHVISDILKRTFALHLNLNRQWFATGDTTFASTGNGTLEVKEDRIFFAPHIYQLSVALLSFNLLVAVLVLMCRPGRSFPLMPTTIGAIASYLAGSSILNDLMYDRITPEELEKDTTKFAYGKHIGVDRLPHIGIERQPYITSLMSYTTTGMTKQKTWNMSHAFGKRRRGML